MCDVNTGVKVVHTRGVLDIKRSCDDLLGGRHNLSRVWIFDTRKIVDDQ